MAPPYTLTRIDWVGANCRLLQARCLERVARGGAGPADCVVPVPADIDAMVATAYLDMAR